MKLKVVLSTGGCSGGDCPTVYQTDRNTFIIQDYKLTKEDKENVNMKTNEDVAEVPFEFLKDLFAQK